MTVTATSTSKTKITRVMASDATHESGSLRTSCVGDDEKYYKRRQQRRIQRQKLIILLTVTTIVLFLTLRSWDTPGSSSPSKNQQNQRVQFPSTSTSRQQSQRQLRQQQANIRKDIRTERKIENGHSKDVRFNNHNVGMTTSQSKERRHLQDMLEDLENAIVKNRKGGTQWVNPQLLVSMDPSKPNPVLESLSHEDEERLRERSRELGRDFYKVKRKHQPPMAWESEPEATNHSPPKIDYTIHSYEYPPLQMEIPEDAGGYPKLVPFQQLMDEWPQDNIDDPPTPYKETLIHFDYSKPEEMKAAMKFRKAKLPFKVYNVPEIDDATMKWTDKYIATQLDSPMTKIKAIAHESSNNFFTYFVNHQWDIDRMGLIPMRGNDWTYKKWAQHARYADTIRLQSDQPHFYLKVDVRDDELMKPKSEWSFISLDLPSFSNPSKNFFSFQPNKQKGIHCRFGERGITTAMHYDAGRNMIAMITGAKRYILSPPSQCGKFGIVTNSNTSIYRQSMLNFGHLSYLNNNNNNNNTISSSTTNNEGKDQQNKSNDEMSSKERAWLERASDALVVDTIVKAGEVLYIPSHWFHYITSLQMNAQCNARNGLDKLGDDTFGGRDNVHENCLPW